MTQKELAELMLRGDRARVSGVERNLVSPNAAEIVAYSLLFGSSPAEIFPAFYEAVEEELIARAYALDQQLSDNPSPLVDRKRQLLHDALARATGKAANPFRL